MLEQAPLYLPCVCPPPTSSPPPVLPCLHIHAAHLLLQLHLHEFPASPHVQTSACPSTHLPIPTPTLAAVKCKILGVDIARASANFLIASSS